jgi:hypothetical protein
VDLGNIVQGIRRRKKNGMIDWGAKDGQRSSDIRVYIKEQICRSI